MCGITGAFHYRSGRPDRETVERMTRVLDHRGPDDKGVVIHGPLALGHARLAIIDPAGGHQPLWNEDRSVAVVCNGEIYNHRALRRRLEARGHVFATGSDSETIVHLYEDLGPACVAELEGMFALAVADFRRRRLLLARDRVGKKPLYVADDGERLLFASELKSFLAAGALGGDLDLEALDLYLAYGYVPAPWTIWRGAAKIPAGHLALVDEHGMRLDRYWELRFREGDPRPGETLEDDALRLDAALGEAVGARLESDVPLGAFLSGGIDSGTVVSYMAERMAEPVRTHTVGFADRATDERDDAALVARALGTDHVAAEVRPEVADLLPRIAWHLDEPFADPSVVPTWYVARETRRRVTVALSGDGGDELFAGYDDRYGMHLAENRLRPWLPRPLRRAVLAPLGRAWPRSPRLPRPLRLGGLFENLSVDAERAYFHDRMLIPGRLQERLFAEPLRARHRRFDPFSALEPHLARAPRNDALARALYLDLSTWLTDDCLVKVDRMSMAHALEVRCPLLDRRVVELAARMPSRHKLWRGESKRVLRAVARRRLPAQIFERPKRGFAPPVSRWLREELHGPARDLLLARDARTATLFARRPLRELLDAHRDGRAEAGWPLWTLLMLETWARACGPAATLEAARLAAEPRWLTVPTAFATPAEVTGAAPA